ncbi:MAG: cupin domain-containing protein [Clostridia bacterium]|nr:cupin domain-containing protein [Clostridia bacterium]
MKKLILGTMIASTLFSVRTFAGEINVDGQRVDTNVDITDGKAVVSARDLLEAMNYAVNWDSETKTINAQNNSNVTLDNKGDLEDAKPIFGLGDYFKADTFTGDVYLNNIANEGEVSIANVTFDEGCINDWHVHDHVQILMGTMGRGYAQMEGQEAEEINVGDVVVIPAGTKHWHGAAKDSQFTHISVSGPVAEGMEAFGTNWLEPVDKAEYDKLS